MAKEEKKDTTPKGGVEKKEEEPKVEVKEEETVTLKKTELDELLERLKRVEFAASKSALSKFDEDNKTEGLKTVKLSTIDGKVVLSWPSMLKNVVEKNPRGVWGEEQTIELIYEDGSTEEMDYVYFGRRKKFIIAEILSKTIENQGKENEKTILKVRTKDGREYTIDKKFAN